MLFFYFYDFIIENYVWIFNFEILKKLIFTFSFKFAVLNKSSIETFQQNSFKFKIYS